MKRNKKAFKLCFILFTAIYLLSQCIYKAEKSSDPRGTAYVGSGSCRQCHKLIHDTYIESAHSKATQAARAKDIRGSFKPPSNMFLFTANNKIVMEERDSGLYQVAYLNGKEQAAYKFDITFGTKHAQTFLTWQNYKTFELPVSYYHSVDSWATSPGFSSSQPDFTRFIGGDCFECHSSYIKSNLNASVNGIEEVLEKNTLVYGIDCERCHGPAVNHVNYHKAYPDIKQAKYIAKFSSLTRQQNLDMCALCHSGNNKMKKFSRFDFRPGDRLANFFFPGGQTTSSDFDVHGNQYQLLSESACFLKSTTLTCTTCHSPHTNAAPDVESYSANCRSCHAHTNHKSTREKFADNDIKRNCIDCHMPKQASRAITFQLAGSQLKSAYLLRTHKIAVYAYDGKKVKSLVSFYDRLKAPGRG